MITLRGVDISENQGDINFDTLAQTVDFVYIRASDGLLPDRKIDRNIQESDRVGLKRGFYHGFRWGIPVEDQIRVNNNILGGVREDYRRVFDQEWSWITKPPINPLYNLEAWRAAHPDGGTYNNPDFIKRFLQDVTISNIPLWIANWNVVTPAIPLPFFPFTWMWQFRVVAGSPYGCKPSPVYVPKIALDIMFI